MTEHYTVLILLMPLFGALVTTLLGRERQNACWLTALICMATSSLFAIGNIGRILASGSGELRYRMGGWQESRGYEVGIELRVDMLAALVVAMVVLVGFVNMIFSKTRVAGEMKDKVSFFYTLKQLLIVGLCGIVMTNDAFNLYVLIEITSLTSYALIAMGNRRAALSSFNYVIMGTIGASFYLLGVGYLYIKTGTLNIDDISLRMQHQYGEPSLMIAFALIMLGIWIKMAFFPLHGWLPNAYSYAPSMVGSFMAPLMTKVMVYVMLRVMLWLFEGEYVYSGRLVWGELIVWMAIIAIVAGSFLALACTDIKKMLTYLIVAEVGYMVGGAWLADGAGITGSMYHILSDAAMTFCLFLAASIVILRTGDHRLTAFTGLFRRMPLTMTGFTIGALSMVGLPPTCGFFSKWYLISGGIDVGHWSYVAALLFSSLVNAVIFFRIIERAYFGKLEEFGNESLPLDADGGPPMTLDRVPYSMLLSLLIASGSVLLVGIYNETLVGWLKAAIPSL